MFDNAGKKIEGFAKFMFWFVLIVCIAATIYGLIFEEELVWIPCVSGAIIAYPFWLLIYGFGQLVDDTHATRRTVSAPTSAGVSRTSAADNDLPEL